MISLRSDLLEMLRCMADKREQPSAMLRALVAQLGPETADRPLLVRYFSTAFSFSEGQAYKLFGWFPDNTGTLKDSDIDRLLCQRIEETRPEWGKVSSEAVIR